VTHRPHHASRLCRPAAAALLAALFCALAAAPTGAATKMEGYYSIYSSSELNDRNWHFGKPSHFAELKFLNTHNQNVESFIKLRVNADNDDDRTTFAEYYTPPWISAEGHIKFRTDHTEVLLFNRQNHFWINDEPLFRLIEDWKVKNDNWGPQAQGVRFEFWEAKPMGLGTWGGTLIYSDNGATFDWGEAYPEIADGDDSIIVRLRNHSWNERLVGGFTFLRKDWTDTSEEANRDRYKWMHNMVYAADLAFFPHDLVETGLHLGPIDLEQSRWTVEAAKSVTPWREFVLNEPTENSYLFGAEVRDIHIDKLILHAWHFDFGENFRDYLSGRFDDSREYNRVQNHVEGIFFVPRKAITAKVSYDHHRKRVRDEPKGGLRPSESIYGEVYVEFIKGFKGRVAYSRWHGFDASSEINDFFTYPGWFGEVSVENFLAKIRLQGRIRDAGTFRQVTAFGFDMNVNITDKLKGYLRMLNVNEEIEARHTMFAQLKYDLGFGAEFYFEYGDAGQSDNIVYTDWFVQDGNNDNLRDRLALSFRSWF
jgi:hypothetical protein